MEVLNNKSKGEKKQNIGSNVMAQRRWVKALSKSLVTGSVPETHMVERPS